MHARKPHDEINKSRVLGNHWPLSDYELAAQQNKRSLEYRLPLRSAQIPSKLSMSIVVSPC